MGDGGRWPALLGGLPLLVLLALPLLALALTATPAELVAGIAHEAFAPALWLSARTSAAALGVVVLTGTPLAWWIATTPGRASRAVEVLAHAPIVLPPAVVGLALLEAFGRQGPLGGLGLPFTTAAVVVAQIIIASPFYLQAAVSAFRAVDPDLLLVARTLGRSPTGAMLQVAAPLALPGLLGGAAVAWARALGEFGATLLFAGNLPGVTQTMPLAIYMSLESDVRVAQALSLALALASLLALGALRLLSGLRAGRRG